MIFDITLRCSDRTVHTVRICAYNRAAAESKLLSDPRYVEILSVVYVGRIK